MSLDNLGEFTNRGTQTTSATVTTEPPTTGAPAPEGGQQQPVAPPPPTLLPTPEPKVEVTPSKPDTFMADMVESFQKSIPEEPLPPEEPARASQKPTEKPEPKAKGEADQPDEFGLPDPPKGFREESKHYWRALRASAHEKIKESQRRIRELEGAMESQLQKFQSDTGDVGKLKEQLDSANKLLEQTAIERSPMFKEKILDQQEAIRSRLGKVIEGTSLTPHDAERLISGDITVREEVLGRHNISPLRQQQVVDLLDRWDQVEDQRNSMVANGKASYQEHLRKLQAEEDARKAQFVRESTAMFEDALTTLAPKIEPYQPIEGNQAWNDSIPILKANARKIFNGEVDKKVLAEVAILAPAAVVYQRIILPAAFKRIQDLTQQIERMRGVSPTVTDRGGDTTTPMPKSQSGDFVRDLVDRFRKEAGA